MAQHGAERYQLFSCNKYLLSRMSYSELWHWVSWDVVLFPCLALGCEMGAHTWRFFRLE